MEAFLGNGIGVELTEIRGKQSYGLHAKHPRLCKALRYKFETRNDNCIIRALININEKLEGTTKFKTNKVKKIDRDVIRKHLDGYQQILEKKIRSYRRKRHLYLPVSMRNS